MIRRGLGDREAVWWEGRAGAVLCFVLDRFLDFISNKSSSCLIK